MSIGHFGIGYYGVGYFVFGYFVLTPLKKSPWRDALAFEVVFPAPRAQSW